MIFGTGLGDDAGVYRLRDDLAIVQTVDFFTPIVDDPYQFGAIAAANALSDCYTLGAQPITVLNLVGFPCKYGLDVLREILRGGADKVREAGAVIVGGHSVEDTEPKFGMAVTGTVHPQRMIGNTNATPGNLLVLNKKVGTGIVTNTFKQRGSFLGSLQSISGGGADFSELTFQEAVESMMQLNKAAGEILEEHGVTACTDITGFGLLGHAQSVAAASGVSFEMFMSEIPIFDGIRANAISGTKGGGDRNKRFIEPYVQLGDGVSDADFSILCDAQTSGPLLSAIPEPHAEQFVQNLKDSGYPAATVVGRVIEAIDGKGGTILVSAKRS